MGQSGSDIQLSPAARQRFPFKVECKSLARFVGYNYYNQATTGSGEGIPIAVIKANHKQPLVLLDFDDFMSLLK